MLPRTIFIITLRTSEMWNFGQWVYVSVHIFSTHATAVTYIAGRYAVEVVVGAGQAVRQAVVPSQSYLIAL